jgi:hypothetical protein
MELRSDVSLPGIVFRVLHQRVFTRRADSQVYGQDVLESVPGDVALQVFENEGMGFNGDNFPVWPNDCGCRYRVGADIGPDVDKCAPRREAAPNESLDGGISIILDIDRQ